MIDDIYIYNFIVQHHMQCTKNELQENTCQLIFLRTMYMFPYMYILYILELYNGTNHITAFSDYYKTASYG